MEFQIFKLNKRRIDKLSDLLIDLGKISVGSVVIGYFLPGLAGEVSTAIFVIGAFISVGMFIMGLILLKEKII